MSTVDIGRASPACQITPTTATCLSSLCAVGLWSRPFKALLTGKNRAQGRDSAEKTAMFVDFLIFLVTDDTVMVFFSPTIFSYLRSQCSYLTAFHWLCSRVRRPVGVGPRKTPVSYGNQHIRSHK